MVINELAAFGYAVATVVFGCLTALMLTLWADRPKAGLVALAEAATAAWAALQSIGALGLLNDPLILLVVEWLRNLAWLTALTSILRDLVDARMLERLATRYGIAAAVAITLLAIYYMTQTTSTASVAGIVIGGLVLSCLNLVLAEQVYRNAPFDVRSSLKYFCVGVAGFSIYDFIVFLWTITNSDMSVNQWAARGFVYAMFAVPLGFAARRPFRLSLDARIPHQIIFYSFGAIAAGFFVIVLMLGDYYIRTYSGSWGGVVRIAWVVAALLGVAVLLVSATVRARLRVFITKSFFQYKYDYRKEWLRFIGTLSGSKHENVADTAVRAVAQIVNSPGGIVWVQEEESANFAPVGAWGADLPSMPQVAHEASLVRFLKSRQWVIDLHEMRQHPARYEGLVLDEPFSDARGWWLVVPMLIGDRLLGFIMLLEPRIVPTLNFEDHDLLRTVGRHAATHIDQAEADKRLTESRQFGAYNRLTAFLMHDLNNLIAQQSLVVKNAEKHRQNPQFVDDAIDTIANSVTRMRRLMEQLADTSAQRAKRKVSVRDVLGSVARRVNLGMPRPVVEVQDDGLFVEADPERLATILEHLIRNAQDATDDDGSIRVEAETHDATVAIRIRDTGCGMTPEFIRERLFRPFDSTKGSQSMGIGAYQAREYVRQLGGYLNVESQPGEGTTFSIELPLA